MIRSFASLIGCLALLWTAAAQAQNAVLNQLYDKGVHAYFSGNYSNATSQFNAAIRAGSRDPRVMYYRGLVNLQNGRTPEARRDFYIGAQLEIKDVNKYYNVGRALERIQGSQRQMLEAYRVQARMAAFAEAEKLRKARYEAIKREEARVLREQVVDASKIQSTETAEPAAQDEGVETIPPAAEGQPAETPEAGMEAQPESKPEADDPFAPKASEEEKPAAEETPPTAEAKAAPKKSILGALGKSLSKSSGIEDTAAKLKGK